jgi:hypothetical protein
MEQWNGGTLEPWNTGFYKHDNHPIFIVNPVGGGCIDPTLHYSLRAGG